MFLFHYQFVPENVYLKEINREYNININIYYQCSYIPPSSEAGSVEELITKTAPHSPQTSPFIRTSPNSHHRASAVCSHAEIVASAY